MNTLRTFYNNKVVPMLKAIWDFVNPILYRLVWPTISVLFVIFVGGKLFADMTDGPIWGPLAFLFLIIFLTAGPNAIYRYIRFLITGKE